MRVRLCGVEFDNVTMQEAVERALQETGEPCVVFTPNAVMLDACRNDAAVREVLNCASLSLADGAGVIKLARRRGMPLKERAAGIDFGEALLKRAAEEGLRTFLLGGGEGIAARAAECLRRLYPSLCICGTSWGYFDQVGEENRQILSRIRASRTDILFVCMGFPLQERWILDNLASLADVRVIAGLGGSLDVWSGSIRRAPAVVSKVGMEWAWRMMREPRRMKQLPALVRCAFWR